MQIRDLLDVVLDVVLREVVEVVLETNAVLDADELMLVNTVIVEVVTSFTVTVFVVCGAL